MVAPVPSARADPALRALAGLVGAHAVVQLTAIVTALAGVTLTAPRARAALACATLLGLLVAARVPGASGPAPAATGPPCAGAANRLAWLLAAAACGWTASLWARLWALARDRPVYDWDGLYYHLPALNAWVAAGRVHWITDFPDVPFVNYPMAVEAHTFVLHQAVGLATVVDALTLWYWPMAVLAVAVLAGAADARGPWRWCAAALVGAAPVMVSQGVTAYVDPAFGACVMAAVALSAVAATGPAPAGWWSWVAWGASLGLVLGAKGTGLPVAVSIALVTIGVAQWGGARVGRAARVAGSLLGLVVAVAVGGYWYARAAWFTGNPVFPIRVAFGAKVIFDGYDAAALMRDNLPGWLARYPAPLRVPVSWLQLDAPIQGYAPTGGLGFIWPVACVPALLAVGWGALRGQRRLAPAALVFALGLVAVLLVVQPAPWWARFTVWLHVLGLSALAVVWRAGCTARSAFARDATVAAAATVILLGAWESERTLRLERARGWVAASGSYQSTASMLFGAFEDTTGVDRFLAARRIARGPWSRAGTLMGGVLATPPGQRSIVYLPREPVSDDLERLDATGVQWVIWDVAAAGPLPDALRRRAIELIAYTASPEVSFVMARLR